MSKQFIDLTVTSSLDRSPEKSLFFFPENAKKAPLIVALHTWSHNRYNQTPNLHFCFERNWAFLLPEARGSNLTDNPRCNQACASELARQDVIDATEYVLNNYAVDPERVILYGGSGGGHMALMTGAYRPELWQCVSAWCPITDLTKWHEQCSVKKSGFNYMPHIEQCCGGKPGDSVAVDETYQNRSPLTWAEQLLRVKRIMLHHGRHDNVVPYSQSLELFNRLEQLEHTRVYLEIFDGEHELFPDEAFRRFDNIIGEKKSSKLTG